MVKMFIQRDLMEKSSNLEELTKFKKFNNSQS